MAKNATVASSKEQRWWTPLPLLQRLDREFGFEWDAAAEKGSAVVNRLAPHARHEPRYFGPDHPIDKFRDALSVDWRAELDAYGAADGPVWLNPPYGRGIRDWMRKCYEESRKGLTIVALMCGRTETRWFHEYVFDHCDEVRLIDGRLWFLDPETGDYRRDESGRPAAGTAGHMIDVWRPHWDGPCRWRAFHVADGSGVAP